MKATEQHIKNLMIYGTVLTKGPGVEIRFERRRYGRVTYTWMEGRIMGTENWTSAGDPWRGTVVSQKDVRDFVEKLINSEEV